MKKLLTKAKSTFHDSQTGAGRSSQQPLQPTTPPSITPIDILRYRYHHGSNLGSIFVLEKWLHGSMFPSSAAGDSELDAVTAAVKEMGIEGARGKWEDHWRGAVSDGEWEWLRDSGRVTSLRVPVGYFTLGEEFCKGTPFEGVRGVYDGAWAAFRDLVAKARSYGIGILIDLHALPGGANTDAHSGSCTGKADLWTSRSNLSLTKRVLEKIAMEAKTMDGVIGIQVVNEAVWDAKGMYDFYETAIDVIGAVDDQMPVYISDGWDLGRALKWCNGRKVGKGRGNPVVVDTHKYYTFSEKDRAQAPQEIIGRIGGEMGELDGKEGALCDRGEGQVVVGEWSCVLDGQTWSRVQPQEKDNLVKQFGLAQSQKWQQRAGGSFFWTYKMDWMDGGEWGFAEQTKKGNIPPPAYLTLSAQDVKNRTQTANDKRQELGDGAKQGHEGYWDKTSPGKKFEHWRYGEGWQLGFGDAVGFFGSRVDGGLGEKAGEGGDRIGCLDIWVKKRLGESGQRGTFGWEWEQGFRAGVKAFESVVGI